MSIDFHEFVCKITEVHWCRQIKVMYILYTQSSDKQQNAKFTDVQFSGIHLFQSSMKVFLRQTRRILSQNAIDNPFCRNQDYVSNDECT